MHYPTQLLTLPNTPTLYPGEYLGLTIICLISYLVAWLGAQFFPPGYIELMGIGPLCLGCYNLVYACLYDVRESVGGGVGEGMTRVYSDIPDMENGDVNTHTHIRTHTHLHTQPRTHTGIKTCTDLTECVPCIHTEVLEVCALMMACGADNIILYSTLFIAAHDDFYTILCIVMLFYGMLFGMLQIAYSVTHIHIVIDTIKHYGVYVVPVIWVCIGLYILSSSILMQYM